MIFHYYQRLYFIGLINLNSPGLVLMNNFECPDLLLLE